MMPWLPAPDASYAFQTSICKLYVYLPHKLLPLGLVPPFANTVNNIYMMTFSAVFETISAKDSMTSTGTKAFLAS